MCPYHIEKIIGGTHDEGWLIAILWLCGLGVSQDYPSECCYEYSKYWLDYSMCDTCIVSGSHKWD